MPLAAAGLVRGALQETLAAVEAEPRFRALLTEVLADYPHALHPDSKLRAALITLGAFQAAGGDGISGVYAAAAMESLIAGCHVLDRMVDRDYRTTSADIQVAPGLLFLTGRLLERARDATPGRVGDYSDTYTNMVAACSGQQMDVDLQENSTPTLEEARRMTDYKAGAFGAAMASAGAITGGVAEPLRARLAAFGAAVGAYGQLVDDASDCSLAAPGTSDIQLRKKTVPIVHFLSQQGDRPEWDSLRTLFSAASLTPEQERAFRTAIEESGSVQFTLGLANWYRIRAEQITQELHEQGCPTRLLRDLLGSTSSTGE